MSEKTFLVEIGTEELPPKLLRNLAEEFAYNFANELNNSIINYNKVNWFATPRRLALKVDHLAYMQSDRKVEKLGPPLSMAFDTEGHATKEAHGWAHSNNITIDQAEYLHTDKGEWLVYRALIKGKSTIVLLPDMINSALKKLSISKLMRWGTSKIQFLRPIHTVTLLLGNELIPATIFGIQSKRLIQGHRFIGEQQFIINNADQYPYLLLKRGKVLADYLIRKANIKANVEAAASQLNGIVDLSDNLLEEITSLVEWPIVLIGKFEKKFLSIPAEALVHTMKEDQKYFPVYSKDGKLLPNFIFVTNIELKDYQQIIIGNEKVIRSRLADAEFFFNTDRKYSLEDNLPRLETIIFHKQLGTLLDKTKRIQGLANWIAKQIGADINHTNRASMLSKCDLMTKMVCEFTDTQGVIGMYYARYDGEVEDVAVAINEQYYPRFAGDILPSNLVACAIAMADKMDTLIGIFGVGQYPKGNKDPFALRRAALGILRIIVEKHLPIDLQTLIEKTVSLYEEKLSNVKVIDDVMNFIFGRFRTWYQQDGYNIDVIKAVMARRPTNPVDFDLRIKAISQLRILNEIQELIIANKRISNILAKTTEKLNDNVQVSLLKDQAEINLATLIYVLEKKLKPYFLEGRYQDALIELAQLSEPIDNFFNNVVVNTNNPEIRINRLTLIAKIRELFLQIADISILN